MTAVCIVNQYLRRLFSGCSAKSFCTLVFIRLVYSFSLSLIYCFYIGTVKVDEPAMLKHFPKKVFFSFIDMMFVKVYL